MNKFNFDNAQAFEFEAHKQHIKNVFKKDWDNLKNDKQAYNELDASLLSKRWEHNFFNGNLDNIKVFIEHIKDKTSLDIGCGCIPWSKDTWVLKVK
jgi:hypothetical protein